MGGVPHTGGHHGDIYSIYMCIHTHTHTHTPHVPTHRLDICNSNRVLYIMDKSPSSGHSAIATTLPTTGTCPMYS